MTPPSPSSSAIAAALGLAVLAISSAALLILLAAPLPPLLIAGGRVTVTGLALGVLAVLSARTPTSSADPRARDRVVPWGRVCAAAGLLAIHFATWVWSLSLTTVLRSTTLVATQPLFAAVVGRLLGDRAPWALWVGAGVAILGSGLMVQPEPVAADAHGALVGDLLAVVAAVAAAAYLAVGRSVRSVLPLRHYLSLVHLIAGAVLLGAAAVRGDFASLQSVGSGDFLAVLALGLVPGVIGHGLLNWGVRHVPVHVVSLAILLEPLGATALAWVALGQVVSRAELLGAAVLLSGVAFAIPRRR